ncbi:MAG: hypothetical protein K9L70_05185 [Thiohalocapsa sp.]|nr:hypothetical protein [Thiohalocapsa sp.]MCF7991988.1 hypothetical protein [Thiohalocapsa sp.]
MSAEEPPRLPVAPVDPAVGAALRTASRLALAVCVAAVAYLAFAPLDAPPVFSYDKSNHLLAFAVMAWLADASWPGPAVARLRWALLLGYGLLIELVQSQLPYRDFSLLDLVANVLGIGMYLLLRATALRVRAAVVG